jgi:hypothetical protein
MALVCGACHILEREEGDEKFHVGVEAQPTFPLRRFAMGLNGPRQGLAKKD